MTGYVVYACEHMRDGNEEWAKCFSHLLDALTWINADRFAKSNFTFRLFELGKEIALDKRIEKKESVTVKETTVYGVKCAVEVQK